MLHFWNYSHQRKHEIFRCRSWAIDHNFPGECMRIQKIVYYRGKHSTSTASTIIVVARRLSGIRKREKKKKRKYLPTFSFINTWKGATIKKKHPELIVSLISVWIWFIFFSPFLLAFKVFFVQQFYSHRYDFRITNAIFGVILMGKCSFDGKNILKEFRIGCFKLFFFLPLLHFITFSFIWFFFLAVLKPFQNRIHNWSSNVCSEIGMTCTRHTLYSSKCVNPFLHHFFFIFSTLFIAIYILIAKLVSGLFPLFN